MKALCFARRNAVQRAAWRAGRMANAAVLKTAVRKDLQVRILCPPLFRTTPARLFRTTTQVRKETSPHITASLRMWGPASAGETRFFVSTRHAIRGLSESLSLVGRPRLRCPRQQGPQSCPATSRSALRRRFPSRFLPTASCEKDPSGDDRPSNAQEHSRIPRPFAIGKLLRYVSAFSLSKNFSASLTRFP